MKSAFLDSAIARPTVSAMINPVKPKLDPFESAWLEKAARLHREAIWPSKPAKDYMVEIQKTIKIMLENIKKTPRDTETYSPFITWEAREALESLDSPYKNAVAQALEEIFRNYCFNAKGDIVPASNSLDAALTPSFAIKPTDEVIFR